MKTTLRLLMLILAVSFVLPTFAQVPQKMNYQAVARNSSGTPITNHLIGIKFTVREASASGPDIFAETMTATTNSMGTFSVEIGGGTPVLGSFATIPWSTGSKFLNIKIDPAGGTSYTDMGTYQLLSVAYAQYAKNVLNNDDADASPTNELQSLSIAGDQLSISSGNTVTLPGGGSGGTPGGATGNVQFNNAGAFAGDNGLFWDNTLKYLGIGTTIPSYPFDILHGGSTGLRVKSSSSFSVVDIDAFSGDAALRFQKGGVGMWNVRNDPGTDNLQFFELGGGGERFRIENTTGNIGINTRLGIGTTNAAVLGGLAEIKGNSTTGDPHILLNESEGDFARIGFKNTVNPTKTWQIAGYADATDANSRLNMWYWNGTSGSDILSITGDGKIGVNVSSPSYSMSIYGASGSSESHYINSTTGSVASDGVRIGIGSSLNAWVWNNENGKLYFGTNNIERMTIAADGKVGIGDITPDATLDVEGTVMVGATGTAFSEIKEITGTTVASGSFTLIAYPSGYTMANTRILSCEINYGGNAWVGLGGTTDPAGASGHVFYYNNASNIWLYHQNHSNFTNRAYRILLMKM